ncbi:MAG: NTP transferase domain-containing protein, partial [Bacteroidales bacterium]|nr:NTP transferase domain-containing protein [Bacteroidales bacterium]
MKPTLLILAAGMGSRYGGLKQLDGVGPNGETIMDYSVYDAIRAGFGEVVFVVRKHFRQDFEARIRSRYGNAIAFNFVEQELESIPVGFNLNPERTKPWGTGHAVMMAAHAINTPFAVINADDYYGQKSFEVLGDFLKEVAGSNGKYCMVGFETYNTLSESGVVSRGICTV